MVDGDPTGEPLKTADVARASGYSVQQVRDLERLGVLPPAARADNGYRRFSDEHVLALRAYRRLAVAVGPLAARRALRETRSMPQDEAVALIGSLHVGLAKERDDALAARQALQRIRDEALADVDEPDATMTIGELAGALGVRPSTLRFWESEGLVSPERVTSRAARRYPPAAVREARITAALRAAGYRVPAVRHAIDAVRRLDVDDTANALSERLGTIARRTMALLEAGTDVAQLLARAPSMRSSPAEDAVARGSRPGTPNSRMVGG